MKRKAEQSKQSSTKHTAESSSTLQNAGKGILYEEATGKTVDYIRMQNSREAGLRLKSGSQTAHSYSSSQFLRFSFG